MLLEHWKDYIQSRGYVSPLQYCLFLFPSPACSSTGKETSPLPALDGSSISTPRKLLDSSQFSTPGSSSGKALRSCMTEDQLEIMASNKFGWKKEMCLFTHPFALDSITSPLNINTYMHHVRPPIYKINQPCISVFTAGGSLHYFPVGERCSDGDKEYRLYIAAY